MRVTPALIRYKVSPDRLQENERLIENVFAELRAKAPDGFAYAVFRLADGSFVHIVTEDGGPSPLFALDAFQTFQRGVKERCIEAPQKNGATVVGNYRMLAD
jgi:hypothetical protein